MPICKSQSDITNYRSDELTIQQIFEDNHNWDRYLLFHQKELREVEIAEVEKMLGCKTEERGCYVCYCKNCDDFHTITFGCNSRICSRCGKRYTDKWSKALKRKLFNVPHRHFVMGMPDLLWILLLEDRSLWKVIMDGAIKAINDVLSHCFRSPIQAGAIVVLHPFGRDLGFKPHIHVILTEGGFDRKGNFRHKKFIPARSMRKTWQYQVLTRLKSALPNTPEMSRFINMLFKKYNEGFYVYLPKESRVNKPGKIARYVARYVRHPAIANFRLYYYDGEKVVFWYQDHDDNKFYVDMFVEEFIYSLIRHIPDRQFKMIRHYGAYCRKWSRRYRHYLVHSSITQAKIEDFGDNRVFCCPKCGSIMEMMGYFPKGPPDELRYGEKITDWEGICARVGS